MPAGASSSRTHQHRAVTGILLMMVGLALYPLSDALIKHLMESYAVAQATFLRSISRLVPLLIAMLFAGGPKVVLGTRQGGRHLVRLAISLVYTYIFMYAYSKQSLTSVYILSYTSPLFLILLGALLLHEKITRERWIAVGIGAVGILIAIRPGVIPFDATCGLVLVGVLLGTLNKIFMRKLAATEHSLAITIYPNIALVAITLPYLIGVWAPMPWKDWGWFSLVGILSAAGQYAIAQSLRFAQASLLAPIDNSTFFWVVFLDFFWWKVLPDPYTLLGVGLIMCSNLFILYYKVRDENKIEI